jgi:hypothetical protein
VLTAKAMTASDKKRLHGRVASVADKGDFSAAGLVDLVRKASDEQMPSGSSTS